VWLRSWAEESALDLGLEVTMPQWDGLNPDYASAVDGLLTAG
jgi:hypothetical protein